MVSPSKILLTTGIAVIGASIVPALAQSISAVTPSNAEEATVFQAQAGSAVWGLDFDPECIGYFAESPTLTLEAQAGQPLAVFAAGEFDAALMIETPNNGFSCNDDAFGTSNSAIRIAETAEGTYRVWAGAFEPQDDMSVQIGIAPTFPTSAEELSGSEFDTVFNAQFDISLVDGDSPLALGGPSDSALEAMLQSQADSRLAFTMTNDANAVSSTAFVTGEQDLSELNFACTGFGNLDNPLIVTAALESSDELIFFTNAGNDLTMMVVSPSGEVRCSDDFGDSRNPLVSFPTTLPGGYEVYVGGYSPALGEELVLTAGPTQSSGNSIIDAAFLEAFGTLDLITEGAGAIDGSSLADGPIAAPIPYLLPSASDLVFELTDQERFIDLQIESYAGLFALNADCSGSGGQAPSLAFSVDDSQTGQMLTIGLESNVDGVMAIFRPDGTVQCNDDGPNGLNPELSLNLDEPGLYRVWFGGYDQQSSFRATSYLRFGSGTQSEPLNLESAPAAPAIAINPGTDVSVTAQANGSRSLTSMSSVVSNCIGTVGSVAIADLQVDQDIQGIVNLSVSDSFLMQSPEGNWICPRENRLVFSPMLTGTYRIWSSAAEVTIDVTTAE